MKMGGIVELLGISWLLFLLLLIGNGHCRDSHQTEHLSSYQLAVPQPIGGRLRRDVNGRLPSQVSYIISVDGSDRVVHLERNELLLPADFTVFSYSPDGSLVTSTPPVQKHADSCFLYLNLSQLVRAERDGRVESSLLTAPTEGRRQSESSRPLRYKTKTPLTIRV